MEKSPFNHKEYRQEKAEELVEKRGKDGINTEEAYKDLENLRNTPEYKEAEELQDLHRQAFRLAKLDGQFEGGKSENKESVSISNLIEKYNIGEISEKFDRTKIEELLSKAESREEKYKILLEQVSHTPLLAISDLLPNGNKLYIKLESESVGGENHYMRIYLQLIKYHEEKGDIKPGDRLYDFTSGSSGVSMAAVATLLGYKCEVGMPAGGEKAREDAILKWIPQEQLHLSDEKLYVKGAPEFNTEYLSGEKKAGRDVFFLSHAMTKTKRRNENNKLETVYVVNEIATNAASKAVDEVKESINEIDTFVAISGNGTTQYGYGNRFKELYPNIEIVGVEAVQSAYVYNRLYPGKFEEKYGISLDDRNKFSRHRLPGSSFPADWDAPALTESVSLLSDEKLVWDKKAVDEYKEITGHDIPDGEIFFDEGVPAELQEFGRTTKVSYKIAEQMAKETQNKNYVIFSYDHADRYDSK